MQLEKMALMASTVDALTGRLRPAGQTFPPSSVSIRFRANDCACAVRPNSFASLRALPEKKQKHHAKFLKSLIRRQMNEN